VGLKTLYIEPGSPWENGSCESFNGKLRDELLNTEIFETLTDAQVVIEAWRKRYNEVRPHSALGCIPPAPPTKLPTEPVVARIMASASPHSASVSAPRLADIPFGGESQVLTHADRFNLNQETRSRPSAVRRSQELDG